jgi:hypothetical protein
MRISVKVETGLVRQGLQDLFAEVPKIGRRQIRTVMERIKRRMQEYPAERPGQSIPTAHAILGTVYQRAPGRYKRTGNLGSHWYIADFKDQGYTIGNTAEHKDKQYGRYVVGDAFGTGQAWMHKGRWQLLRDVTDEEIDKLPPEIIKEIQLVARREGFGTA